MTRGRVSSTSKAHTVLSLSTTMISWSGSSQIGLSLLWSQRTRMLKSLFLMTSCNWDSSQHRMEVMTSSCVRFQRLKMQCMLSSGSGRGMVSKYRTLILTSAVDMMALGRIGRSLRFAPTTLASWDMSTWGTWMEECTTIAISHGTLSWTESTIGWIQPMAEDKLSSFWLLTVG